MKLIIDIDENVFTRLFDNGVDISSDDRKVIDSAIRKGNPYEDKTGHWIENTNIFGEGTYECSNCGNPWSLMEGTPADNDMNYCPYCGADMRGKENDTN